jgi:hypothetical protein
LFFFLPFPLGICWKKSHKQNARHDGGRLVVGAEGAVGRAAGA